MKQATMVPVEEYLSTDYSPDCDYVDGEVIERNVGERNHSVVQRELILLFHGRANLMGFQSGRSHACKSPRLVTGYQMSAFMWVRARSLRCSVNPVFVHRNSLGRRQNEPNAE